MALAPRFTSPYFYWPNAAGVPIPGAQLFFFVTETDAPAPTYSDPALTVPNQNPVIANGAGFFAAIFLDPSVTYKVQLFDGTYPFPGVQIWTADPYPG